MRSHRPMMTMPIICVCICLSLCLCLCVFVFDSVFMMRSHRSPGRPLMTMPSITLMETLQGVQGHNRTKKHQSPRKPQINQNGNQTTKTDKSTNHQGNHRPSHMGWEGYFLPNCLGNPTFCWSIKRVFGLSKRQKWMLWLIIVAVLKSKLYIYHLYFSCTSKYLLFQSDFPSIFDFQIFVNI